LFPGDQGDNLPGAGSDTLSAGDAETLLNNRQPIFTHLDGAKRTDAHTVSKPKTAVDTRLWSTGSIMGGKTGFNPYINKSVGNLISATLAMDCCHPPFSSGYENA